MSEKRKFHANNQSLFSQKEQDAVVSNNKVLLEAMKFAKNVKEWNSMRVKVAADFKGDGTERIILFGYIDGILYPKLFGKKK